LVISDSSRLKYLLIALVGIIFIFGIYSLMVAWPSGLDLAHRPLWLPAHDRWHLCHARCVPLSRSARSAPHLSLIWFTVWSTVVHSGIMAVRW